jgi:hypothetical protein
VVPHWQTNGLKPHQEWFKVARDPKFGWRFLDVPKRILGSVPLLLLGGLFLFNLMF